MTTSSTCSRNVNKPYLFEIALEVANKVGGIYTVIKSKVPVTFEEYGGRYCLIGIVSHSSQMEVEEIVPPTVELKESVESMRKAGIRVIFGKWLIECAPFVILFDIGSAWGRLNEWKGDFQRNHGIHGPDNDKEMNDSIVFGYLVAWFLGEFAFRNKRNALIAHFHEWLASVALPLVKKRGLDVATIFTTHATILGRYLCAGSADFYNNLHLFDVDHEAGKRGIYHRYCIERAASHCADVFTTVSHITAYEAENLLKRKPDGVLPNGLNVVKFSAVHEFQNLHAQYKEKITEFVRGHFYGHLDFDLDNTLFFFTAGRYEYRNKGVDMFLEALARVNQQLKHINSPITVVAFIIMPAPNHSYSVDALKGQAVIKQLRETVSLVQENIGKRIFESCSRALLPNSKEIVNDDEINLLKRRIFALRRDCPPPVVTHNMVDDANDPILNEIRRLGLTNNRSDRVKVVFHPEFLNSNNPLFGLDYDDFVRGTHLGCFASYYEPYGYTPAECTVMGIPSITSNLSGFGCFIEEYIENPSDYGIYIVDRRTKSIEESIQQLTDYMTSFCQKSRRQRINQRNRTERLSEILDWKQLGIEYVKARHLAMRRKYPDAPSFQQETSEDSDDDEMPANILEPVTPNEYLHSSKNAMLITTTTLDDNKKIGPPLSAVTSPKFRENVNKNEMQLQELRTPSSGAVDAAAVSEKLESLTVNIPAAVSNSGKHQP